MAHLNITFNGLSADYSLELDALMSDADIKRIATEVVRSGEVDLNVKLLADDAFEEFVVDRMQDGTRIYLRPKVPFG